MTISDAPSGQTCDRWGQGEGNHSRTVPQASGWLGWWMVLVGAAVLYLLTLAPDLVWQDQGDYQYQAALCNLNRPGDVVRVHPLFIVTAHAVGQLRWFSYAYAANLVSAVFTAMTVANIYLLVYRLVGQIGPALLSAGTFALAHSVWFLGVQAQTYSMANAALTGSALAVLVYLNNGKIRWLYVMGLISGAGISAHLMSQIGFAVIMVALFIYCLRRGLPFRCWLGIIGGWVIGAGLLWLVMALEYQRSGDGWGTVVSAMWGRWGSAVFNVERIPVLVKKSVLFFFLNFPTPLVLWAGAGVYYSFRRLTHHGLRWMLLAGTIAYGLFAVRYDVPNQNNFFLPMYFLVSVYIGLGLAFFCQSHRKVWTAVSLVLLGAIPVTYGGLARYAETRDIRLGTQREIPYRNVYRYYLLPWQQHQTGPRQLVNGLVKTLPAGAIIIPDSTTASCIQYALEIERARADLTLVSLGEPVPAGVRESGSRRRMFTISNVKGYYPQWVENTDWLVPFAISETEHIFEIVMPETTQSL